MSDPIKIGQTITYKGEQWKVIGVGATNPDNGKVYLHLAHTTKGAAQHNGFRPLQACDWVDLGEAGGEGIKLPANFQQWNRAMRGAYLKGRRAVEAGEPEASCPYKDKRKESGRLTWSRAFQAAWYDGYRDAQKKKERA